MRVLCIALETFLYISRIVLKLRITHTCSPTRQGAGNKGRASEREDRLSSWSRCAGEGALKKPRTPQRKAL